MGYKSGDYEQSVGPDPWRQGRYEARAQSEVYATRGAIGTVLEDAGYMLGDADQWGETYRSRDPAYLEIDVDDLDPVDERCLIRMRRSNLRQDQESMELETIRLQYEALLGAIAARYYPAQYRREMVPYLSI